MKKKISTFIINLKAELKKITWQTKAGLIADAKFTVFSTIILAILIMGVDSIFEFIILRFL